LAPLRSYFFFFFLAAFFFVATVCPSSLRFDSCDFQPREIPRLVVKLGHTQDIAVWVYCCQWKNALTALGLNGRRGGPYVQDKLGTARGIVLAIVIALAIMVALARLLPHAR